MALRGKVFWIAAASGLLMRALLWLLSALGFSVSSQNDGWIAFGVAAGVAFLVVIDEVDGMRRSYAQELWKIRVEANREAVEWFQANGGLGHLYAGLDGWNKTLHDVVTTATMKEATSGLEEHVAKAALEDEK